MGFFTCIKLHFCVSLANKAVTAVLTGWELFFSGEFSYINKWKSCTNTLCSQHYPGRRTAASPRSLPSVRGPRRRPGREAPPCPAGATAQGPRNRGCLVLLCLTVCLLMNTLTIFLIIFSQNAH